MRAITAIGALPSILPMRAVPAKSWALPAQRSRFHRRRIKERHYLTVTGLQWVDLNNDGLINANVENAQVHYIDPATGKPGSSTIGGQNLPGDPVRVAYGNFPQAELVMTVSESPIPEPATLGLLTFGALGVLVRRKKS